MELWRAAGDVNRGDIVCLDDLKTPLQGLPAHHLPATGPGTHMAMLALEITLPRNVEL